MVTSPLVRFTTTPEQPPGHAGLAPLLVNRCSNEVEMSVHVSAAAAAKWARLVATQATKTVPSRDGRHVQKIECIGVRKVTTSLQKSRQRTSTFWDAGF